MQKNGHRAARLPGLILPLAALVALSSSPAQANAPQRTTEASRPDIPLKLVISMFSLQFDTLHV